MANKHGMIGKKLITFKTVESTNLTAAELINAQNIEDGTVIISSFQEHGKGQEGNYWESEPGKNLLISVIIMPEFLKPEKQFILNKMVSLAVAEFVQRYAPKNSVKIKWPNDIYVGEQKIAGILINNFIQGNVLSASILGIGININQKVFTSNAPNPVSLIRFMKEDLDLNQALKLLCDSLNHWYSQMELGLYKSIDKKYISLLYRYEAYHAYLISSKKVVAKITGINEYGRLKLEGKNGEMYDCDLKEVAFVI
ncbi:MAG: biotin--[acetyl-CoA-carboxylase] ligase [Bacteroidetes bacterium HGW-Bacteroidetes-17]|jgi:BirA family biotin operon repressor/biotin-[acetyl-CoA-carboxylase] ligase|nr:MAG: biotin--[acetyl-CoA-carboxylase] ligase [Bacteroidetes bacterium HGW-Bacteroidetes-17]